MSDDGLSRAEWEADRERRIRALEARHAGAAWFPREGSAGGRIGRPRHPFTEAVLRLAPGERLVSDLPAWKARACVKSARRLGARLHTSVDGEGRLVVERLCEADSPQRTQSCAEGKPAGNPCGRPRHPFTEAVLRLAPRERLVVRDVPVRKARWLVMDAKRRYGVKLRTYTDGEGRLVVERLCEADSPQRTQSCAEGRRSR